MVPENKHMSSISGVMSEKTFALFSEFVQTELGIKMPPAKKTMLQSRLLKRLRTLGKTSYREYYDYVFSSQGLNGELVNLIDVITTNKTDFFREPKHFDYLFQTVLPELINSRGAGVRRKVRIWSAGCSTGEEPYTLAMVLSEYAAACRGFQFTILATDISARVLEAAKIAIYDHQKAAPIPMALRKRYLLQSKDKSKRQVRIVSELRSTVHFQRLNFMDSDFGLRDTMDIIFCRNVIIYFDRPTQERVLNRLCRHLNPGGYMFMGHSETLNGLKVPLIQVAPTIYRRS
jgi:chemotaxis protein methyltransferase CheR